VLQTVALVEELLAQLPDPAAAAQFTVVCADVDTADLASQRLRNAVAVLDPEDSGVTGGPVIIVSPRADQVRYPWLEQGSALAKVPGTLHVAPVDQHMTYVAPAPANLMPLISRYGRSHTYGMLLWQVADAQEMLFGWRGALAVTLNAAWDPEQVDPDLKSFVKAFDAIYVFQPLSIQVRVQGSEWKFD